MCRQDIWDLDIVEKLGSKMKLLDCVGIIKGGIQNEKMVCG